MKLLSILGGADNFAQIQIHPVIAAHQMAIVCFTIFQLDKHWTANGRA